MVIVRILGGFASQIGKYNFGLAISRMLNTELALDISDYINGYFRPLMLEYLDLENCKIYTKVDKKQFVKVSNGKELLDCIKKRRKNIYIINEENEYQDFFNEYKDLELSPKSPIFDRMRLKQESDVLRKFADIVDHHTSIAIHIRLGDYVRLGWNDDIEKYKNAIGYILKKHPNAKVFMFSNDIEYVKKKIGGHKNFYFVDHHNGTIGDLEEFFCMSKCEHIVLSSTSGFSRYAAFLGKRLKESTKIYGLRNLGIEGAHCFSDVEMEEGGTFFDSIPKEDIHDFGFKATLKKYNPIVGFLKKTLDPNFQRNVVSVNNNILIISNEKLTVDRFKNLQLLAIMFGVIGSNVVYINVNEKSDNKLISADVLEPLTDWDGLEIGVKGINMKNRLIELPKDIRGLFQPSCLGDKNLTIISDVMIKSETKYIKVNNSQVGLSRSVRYYANTILQSGFGVKFSRDYVVKCIKPAVTESNIVFLNNIEDEDTVYSSYCKPIYNLFCEIKNKYFAPDALNE